MPITILPPKPPPQPYDREDVDSDSDSSVGGADLDGDLSMRPTKRRRHDDAAYQIVTPGEIITEDPQWMRHVSHLPSLRPAY